jgi:hypothetical protein
MAVSLMTRRELNSFYHFIHVQQNDTFLKSRASVEDLDINEDITAEL